jgi:hypothetical protein
MASVLVVGSAHDDAGVETLKAAARQRIAAGGLCREQGRDQDDAAVIETFRTVPVFAICR